MSPESSADNLPELFDNGADAEVQLSRSSSAVFRPCLFGEDMLLNEEELSDFPEASCYKNKTGKESYFCSSSHVKRRSDKQIA